MAPQSFSKNLLPILSVALLLVTLGAAFGELSGRGALIGMISTCVLAVVTAFFNGTRYGVSSLTGPMTAAVAVVFAAESGSSELLSLTLMMAALILFLIQFLDLRKYVQLIPNLVVAGFVNGIAALIVISQLNSISGSMNWIILGVTFLLSLFANQLKEKALGHYWELLISPFSIIVVLSLIVNLLGLPADFISVAEGASSTLGLDMPKFSFSAIQIAFFLALELAIIALLDTLLTSMIMEKESGEKSKLKLEVRGQSLGLFLISLFGGVPGAQSTVPSMMFYKEGAHHKYAKLALALTTVLLSLLLFPLLSFIPSAVLAGVIFKIAFDVADLTSLKKAKGIQWVMLLGTLASTVFLSLNAAVIGFTLVFVVWNSFSPKRLQIPDLKLGTETEGLIDEL